MCQLSNINAHYVWVHLNPWPLQGRKSESLHCCHSLPVRDQGLFALPDLMHTPGCCSTVMAFLLYSGDLCWGVCWRLLLIPGSNCESQATSAERRTAAGINTSETLPLEHRWQFMKCQEEEARLLSSQTVCRGRRLELIDGSTNTTTAVLCLADSQCS